MLKLYGVARSRASRNLWLLAEMDQPYQLIPVVQANRAKEGELNTRSPEFLALSTAGAIPVIEDDGLVLGDSLAINLYLAKKHGGPLGPKDAAEEALMVQSALYAATAIEPDAVQILYIYGSGRETSDAQTLDRHVAALARPLAVIEALIEAQGHPVGGRFTVADINLAEVLRYAQTHKPLIAAHPAISAWLAACQARPGFKAMSALRMAEPA
jgi:glutathione S-transferase